MEKPTPEKTLLTPKEAVDYAAHYLNISREEAGKLLAEERPLNAQIYFERDPMGVDYLSHPGKEGYWSKAFFPAPQDRNGMPA